MRIVKLDSNECGGFRPPKGHMDTQMYPECKGWPTDRDIVKKTEEKIKKKKKKKSSTNEQSKETKEAKHSWPIMRGKEHENEGIWEKWLNGKIDDKEFVDRMKQVITMGFTGLTKDPMVRDGIVSTLRAFDNTGDYSDTARSLSGWLAAGKDIVEDDELELNMASIGDEMKITTAKKKKKEWDPNPWAVCEVSVGKKKDPEKFERCVKKVKKQQTNKDAFNLSKFIKVADQYEVVDSEFNRKNYPDMIGKVLDNPPAYAQVKVVKE